MSLCEGAGRLCQQRYHSSGGQRTVRRDERIEGDAIDKLHGIVEHATLGSAVIIDHDRVRVRQPTGHLNLALKPCQARFAARARRQEFDSRRTPKHRVTCLIHHPHRPLAQLLGERVLSKLERGFHLPVQPSNHPRDGPSGGEQQADQRTHGQGGPGCDPAADLTWL